MKELLQFIVDELVDEPDAASIREREGRFAVTLELTVARDDAGKVIGRGGRTARALRTVVASVGGRNVRVDVVDTDEVR